MMTTTVSARAGTAVEEQALLNFARQELSSDLLKATNDLLHQPINWDRLIEMAWRHGTASLVHRHISSGAFQATVPEESRTRLRQCYVRSAFRSQTHFAAITALLREFEQRALPVMLLKGAALGLTTYRDPALRPYADIDLLVREKDIDTAKDALRACGYDLAPELTSEKLSRRFHVNLPFARTGNPPVHIELHWALSDRFSTYEFPMDELWSRARRLAVNDATALVLDLHDAIIYLAAHLDKHGYFNHALAGSPGAARWILDELSANRLIWFTDLHELITQNKIDWSVIAARLRDGELRAVVGTTLHLLRELLGTDIPLVATPATTARRSQVLARRAAEFAAKNEGRRRFFRERILATRKGFELRPVRMLSLWDYVFRGGGIGHSTRAIGRAGGLLCSLVAERARNFAKRRL